MKLWGRKAKVQAEADALEALKAKIEAGVELAIAKQDLSAALSQAERIREMNKQNHFSESLQRSFRGNPA